jgi:DNA-binding NarL/FixJ family response regulator
MGLTHVLESDSAKPDRQAAHADHRRAVGHAGSARHGRPPAAPATRPVERRPRNEPVYYAALCAAPYYVTTRELEVLDLLLSGLSNKEVGGKLGISFKTVQSHRQRIMDKLGARSPMHLAEIVRKVAA